MRGGVVCLESGGVGGESAADDLLYDAGVEVDTAPEASHLWREIAMMRRSSAAVCWGRRSETTVVGFY